jgi:hypothetical protein
MASRQRKIPEMKTAFAKFTPESLYQKGAEMVTTAKDNFKGPLFGKVDESYDDKSAALELFNWAADYGNWYTKWAQPVIDNLKKHLAKGKYNSTQAVKSWSRAADAAADMYAKEYGERGAKGKEMFPANIRKMVAKAMEAEYKQIVNAESK